MEQKATHILIADDEARLRTMLRTYLEEQGFRVSEAANGSQFRRRLEEFQVDLILLDLVIPGEDGLSLMRLVRQTSQVPVIMVTSRDDVIDRVTGLELGADDYICKPFHLRELLARIRAVLRRHEQQTLGGGAAVDTGKRLRIDGLELDPGRRELRRTSGERVPLTSAEFNLLHALARQPNRVLSRDQLMTLTKGVAWNALDRSIDQQIVRLRHKVEENPRAPALIKTVRGAGYMLAGTVEEL